MRYIFETKVKQIYEQKDKRHISGFGSDAVFEDISRGWFALLEGSWEALHLGKDKPELKPGDKIKVIIERIT